MHPYVLAVTGASAQPLAERSLQLLLANDRKVHFVLSRGAHEVFRAEQGLSIPVDPVIAPRETPWNLIHLRNLTALAEAGATIAPPTPAWYTQPKSLSDMVDFLVVRLFDGLDEELAPLQRWTGPLQ